MITEDQTGVIDFLAAPSTHGGEVERIDTHDPSSFSRDVTIACRGRRPTAALPATPGVSRCGVGPGGWITKG